MKSKSLKITKKSNGKCQVSIQGTKFWNVKESKSCDKWNHNEALADVMRVKVHL